MAAVTEIRYSPHRLLAGPAVGILVAAIIGGLAIAMGSPYGAAIAAVAALLAIVWGTAVRRRLSGDPVALGRDGDRLVGDALPEPLPIHDATFAIVSEREGGWSVRLEAGGRTVALQARAWRLPGDRRPSRAAVAEALEALGVHQRA